MSDASISLTEPEQSQVPASTVQAEQERWDIKWRRGKVLELLSQGKNQREIARELQVHESTISRDLDYIQKEIDEAHQNWVQHVFRENQIVLIGMNEILKDAWRIARDEQLDLSDRMKAYELIISCYNNKLTAVYNKRLTGALREEYKTWLQKEEQVAEPQ
jgi:Trp operon repressor